MIKIPAIRTKYKNRIYRSRLEAKWAAFFDIMGWSFEYEPYDLNGWIPDFVIFGKEENEDTEILVEVKPFMSQHQYNITKINKAMIDTIKEGCERLLLGTTIRRAHIFTNGTAIGYLSAIDNFNGPNEAILNCYNCQMGFFDDIGSYMDRITGIRDGDHCLDIYPYSDAIILWNEASNMVGWKI